MKKINEISMFIYIGYILLNIFYIIICGVFFLNTFTYKIFFLSFTGAIALPFAFFYLIIYNLFLFIFVYKFCVENKYPGWVWLCLATFIPNYFGLIAFIALVRFREVSLKFYNYLTIPGYDTNKEKCKDCGNYVDEKFSICPYCGSGTKNYCDNCKEEILNEYQYCSNCGKKVNN